MRKFNLEVFNETVEGTTERYSGAQFNDQLGSADKLIVQYRALKVSGTSPTLTLALYGSNNGTDWVLLQTVVNAASLTVGSVNTNAVPLSKGSRKVFCVWPPAFFSEMPSAAASS